VVHYCEQRDSLRLENVLEPFYGFIDRMIARLSMIPLTLASASLLDPDAIITSS